MVRNGLLFGRGGMDGNFFRRKIEVFGRLN